MKSVFTVKACSLAALLMLAACTSTPPPAPDEPAGASIDTKENVLQNPAVIGLLEQAEEQHDSGDLLRASATLERALRIAPRDPRIRTRLGWLRLDQNDPFQAKELARMAVVYASGQPELQAEAWDVIAAAERMIGNQVEAELAAQEARRLRQ